MSKLYTEEEVRQALWKTEHPYSDGKNVDEIMKSISPIELPTDEDIIEASEEEVEGDFSPSEEFQRGAKYVLDKIKGGDNG